MEPTQPYATVTDLMSRKDPVLLGQLASDDPDTIVSADDLPTTQCVLDVLADASGEVDAACLIAQRYTPYQLANLDGNSLNMLKRLVCTLAFTFLRRRRGFEGEDLEEFKQALEMLEQLRKGERIFGDVPGVAEAGNPEVAPLSPVVQWQQGMLSALASGRNGMIPSRPYPLRGFPRRHW